MTTLTPKVRHQKSGDLEDRRQIFVKNVWIRVVFSLTMSWTTNSTHSTKVNDRLEHAVENLARVGEEPNGTQNIDHSLSKLVGSYWETL